MRRTIDGVESPVRSVTEVGKPAGEVTWIDKEKMVRAWESQTAVMRDIVRVVERNEIDNRQTRRTVAIAALVVAAMTAANVFVALRTWDAQRAAAESTVLAAREVRDDVRATREAVDGVKAIQKDLDRSFGAVSRAGAEQSRATEALATAADPSVSPAAKKAAAREAVDAAKSAVRQAEAGLEKGE